MRFRIEHGELAAALQNAVRAVPARTSLPALTGFLLEAGEGRLRVAATDMELGVEATVAADTEVPGTVVVPARYLADMSRRVEAGRVEFSLDGEEAGMVTVRSGSAEFRIQGLPAEHFPAVAEPEDAVSAVVPREALAAALGTAVVAAAKDEARLILTGVLLTLSQDGVEALASDGYRIAHRRLGAAVRGGPLSAVLPARSVLELTRLRWPDGEIEIRAGTNLVSFSGEGLRLVSRVLEGSFPGVLAMLPKEYPTRVTLLREPFLRALERVALIADPALGPPAVTLRCAADSLLLSASASGIGSAREELPWGCEGPAVEAIFNAAFLRDGVEHAPGEEVRLELSGPLSAARVTAEGEGYLYAVMPMRPQEEV